MTKFNIAIRMPAKGANNMIDIKGSFLPNWDFIEIGIAGIFQHSQAKKSFIKKKPFEITFLSNEGFSRQFALGSGKI